jgi:transcriptional regulator with XRE-family HTH domain
MNKNTDQLSYLLRSRRLMLGQRLEDVAFRAGVDVAGLSRAENGKKIPAPETLAALATALELPLADLYEAAGYPLPQELPTLRPYLRRAYGVPEEAVHEIEQYLERIARDYGGTVSAPVDREDEQPD